MQMYYTHDNNTTIFNCQREKCRLFIFLFEGCATFVYELSGAPFVRHFDDYIILHGARAKTLLSCPFWAEIKCSLMELIILIKMLHIINIFLVFLQHCCQCHKVKYILHHKFPFVKNFFGDPKKIFHNKLTNMSIFAWF